MSGSRVLPNLLLLATGQLTTWLLSTLYLMLVGKYFGPTNLGEIGLAGSLAAMLAMVVRLGMEPLLIRAVARNPARTRELGMAAVVLRIVLSLPMFAVLIVYLQISTLNHDTRVAAVVLLCSMVIETLGSALNATIQGHEQMSVGVVNQVLKSINEIGVILLTILAGGGVVFFVLASVPIELVLLVYIARAFLRLTRPQWRLRAPSLWIIRRVTLVEVLSGSVPFWIAGVFLTIYTYIDTLVLGALAGTHAVGIYTSAVRLCSIGFFLPTIVNAATMPLLARLGQTANGDFLVASRKTLSLLLAGAVPLTIALISFAPALMIAIYGPAFRQSIPVLQVLGLTLVPTFLNMQASLVLAASDRQWRWALVLALSCVVNPLLNLLAIPLAATQWHNPALGAALALVLTEIGMSAYAMVPLRDVVTRAFGRYVAGALAAGAVQIALLRLLSSWWAIPAETLALLAYLALAVPFGAIARNDARAAAALLLQAARRRQAHPDHPTRPAAARVSELR